MIVHYKQGTTDFSGMDNIITPLVIQAEVERKINGIFNAELLIIKDSEMKYDKIKTLDFLKISTPGGEQLFRIVDIDDTATHTITVFCKHIFFDLQKRLIKDTFIQQRNGTQALQQILNSLDEPTEFMAFSDITTLNNLRLVRTKGVDAILGGNQDNYLIKRYIGELDVDNFRIKLLKKLGADKGYEIREGKNLTGYDYKEDSSELCTRLMPVLFDGKLIPENYVDSPNINKYDIVHTNTVKFDDIKLKERNDDGTLKPDTEDYINEGYITENDMYIEARKRCKKLFEEGLDKVRIQASVNFVDLSKTEQYKDFAFLHRLDLGDTVHFILEKYKLRVAERIVAYRYNPLTKEYNELVLGHAQDSIFSSGGGINGSGGSNSGDVGSGDGEGTPNIDFDKWYEQIIKDVTNQIHNGMKDSYVLVRANEILIMDTKDISTAQKVWRWNRGGLGFSSNGYNGTYSTAMTSNGQFVINEITCQKFIGDMIDVGTLQADRLSVEAKSAIRDGLVSNADFNVTMNNITAKVSENLANGGVVKGMATELTKDYFRVKDLNNSARVDIATGKISTRDVNGNMSIDVANKYIDFYNWQVNNQKAGSIGALAVRNTSEYGVGLWGEDSANRVYVGFAESSGEIDHFLVCKKEENAVVATRQIYANEGLNVVNVNQSNRDNAINIGRIYLKSNSVNGEWKTGGTGWLRLNLWNSNTVVVGSGNGETSGTGQYGTIRAGTFQTMKSIEVSTQNTKIASHSAQSVHETISDIGHSKIGENGECIIFFDDDFLSFADTKTSYFITYETVGRNSTQVKTYEKNDKYFIVGGEVGQEFTYKIECKKIGTNCTRYFRYIAQDHEVLNKGLDGTQTIKSDYDKKETNVGVLSYIKELKEQQNIKQMEYLKELKESNPAMRMANELTEIKKLEEFKDGKL